MCTLAKFFIPIFLFWSHGRCVLERGACVTFLWTHPTPQTFLDAGSAQKLIHSVSNCEISNIGISRFKIEVEMQVLNESKEKELIGILMPGDLDSILWERTLAKGSLNEV